MENKHYDINYLQNTRRLLKSLKEHSYTPFGALREGTVLDLGCGAGNDVVELSKSLGDHIKVVGIDHDSEMIRQARKVAGDNPNVEFVLSEAYPLPFDNESMSGIRTERVIQHLPAPEKVITEAYRVLKTDHSLVAVETDWNSLSFYTSYIDVQRKVNNYLTDIKVKNGFAAQKLTEYLRDVGFKNIKFEIHPFVINSLKDANEYFWIERIVSEASDLGYIDKTEQNSFIGSLRSSDENEFFSCSVNLVMASAQK